MNGATLAELHNNWEMGSSIWASIIGFYPFNFVSTTKIVLAACFAIGPLLQRATSVTSVPITDSLRLLVPAVFSNSSLKMTNFSRYSVINGKPNYFTVISREFVSVIADHQARKPMNLNFPTRYCNGTCFGKV